MKRSDIRKIIQSVISDSVLSAYVDKPITHIKELETNLAHDILIEIEKAGMLAPPDRTDAATDGIVYCYYVNEQVEDTGESYNSNVNADLLWDKE